MKNYLLTACSVLLLACTSGQNAAPTFDTVGMDALLSDAVAQGEVIGVSALVFDEGQTVYRGAFGLGDRERGVDVNNETLWRIYSMTKPVTAVLIMDLVEEGRLSLEDPAQKYIPQLSQMQVARMDEDGQLQFIPQAQSMTIEDLLLHRAGLAYGIFPEINPVDALYDKAGLLDPKEDMAAKVQKLGGLPLIAQPGTAWYYSLSMDVLGHIAEVIEGAPLGEILQARYFGPMGMEDTGFSVPVAESERFVSNYMLTADGTFALAEDGQSSDFIAGSDARWQSGGGGLVSTLDDYAKFAQMLLQGGTYDGQRFLREETVKMMMTDQLRADTAILFPWIGGETGTGFGYGGSVQKTATLAQQTEAGLFPGQWGWGGAARTNFWIDPKNDAFGIIMLQFFSAEDPALHAEFRALALRETRND